MDHSYFKERISAYADNALPPYEQMAVQEHLESCPECRAAFEKILKLTSWIDSEANLSGEEYFELQAQKIEARLGLVQTEVTPIRKKSWQGLGWKLTTVAASIALVGIVVYLSKDTVLEKSATPTLNAPEIPKQESIEKTEPSPSVSTKLVVPKKATREAESKDQAAPDTMTELSTQTLTKSKKATTPTEDENYKTSPQMMVPLSAPVETVSVQAEEDQVRPAETKPSSRDELKLESIAGKAVETTAQVVKGKRGGIMKILTSGERLNQPESIKAQPVQKVDDLLKSVAGVKTDSSGEVFIRGGRAGEVEYAVDSMPKTDSLHQAPIKIESDVLAYWYTVCDSLEKERQDKSVVDKVISQANRTVQKETAPMLFADRPPEPRLTLAEAYFRIARISHDSTEIARVTDSLKSIATDPKSPDRTQAKAYLDSLGVK